MGEWEKGDPRGKLERRFSRCDEAHETGSKAE